METAPWIFILVICCQSVCSVASSLSSTINCQTVENLYAWHKLLYSVTVYTVKKRKLPTIFARYPATHNLLEATLRGKERRTVMGNSMTELRGVTRHTGSHSVTCHPTQASTRRLQSTRWMDGWLGFNGILSTRCGIGWYSNIYVSQMDERLSWPRWPDSAPAWSQTRDSFDRKI